jgi:uncharacterized protein YecE (DUF72 family)
MKIFTGTSGYSYKEWKGKFYPDKISADKMLSFYASRLKTVEINNTFYRMPVMNVIESWAEQVPSGFIFAVKAPQIITHIKRLKNVSEETKYFLTVVSGLGKKLGPILFQFPGSFKQDTELLENLLGHISPKLICAFDFRSKTWLNKETYDLLGKRDFGLCLEDTDDTPVTDIISTASWGYLRLRRTDYTEAELVEWAKNIVSRKWNEAFIFFKHEDDKAAKGPGFALRFSELCLELEQKDKRKQSDILTPFVPRL